MKGVYAAQFLAKLEEDIDGPIHRYFDLIAGTSTGGIIAIGLALGVPAKEILDMYVEHAPKIFGQTGNAKSIRVLQRTARWFKYRAVGKTLNAKALNQAIKSVLSDQVMGDAKTRLCIPAVSGAKSYPRVFKTRHHKDYITDHKYPAADIAMATAAPPTYTYAWDVEEEGNMVDGALWANNPSAVAVVEAITKLNWQPEEIHLLSIGSCPEAHKVDKSYSAARFATVGVQITMHTQSRASHNMARLLLGGKSARDRIIRVQEDEDSRAPNLDNVDNIKQLRQFAKTNYVPHSKDIIDTFCRTQTDAFVPVPEEEY